MNENEPLTASSEYWLSYFKQAKIDLEHINKALLEDVETASAENIKLKEAIKELLSELKEKETSLDSSQNLIMKLKNEYTSLINEYQGMDAKNKKLIEELEGMKKEKELSKSSLEKAEKNFKIAEHLKKENERLGKEILQTKSSLVNKINQYNKKEKDYREQEGILNDMKTKSENWIAMVRDRDRLITEYQNKVVSLNEQIKHKEEELKIMVNFSKTINNENKSNVKELTKQAVKTIKIFYNTLSNNNNVSENQNQVEIKYDKGFDCNSFFVELKASKKCLLKLEDALSSYLFIPDSNKYITKEVLMDMNFKTELIKIELFSSYIREMNFVSFLAELFKKISPENTQNLSSTELCAKIIMLKNNFESCQKENELLKRENFFLREKIKEQNLYTYKIRDDMTNQMKKMREKIEVITNYCSMNIALKTKPVKSEKAVSKHSRNYEVIIPNNLREGYTLDNFRNFKNLEITHDIEKFKTLFVSPEINFDIKSEKKFSLTPIPLDNITPYQRTQSDVSFQINETSFNEKNYRQKKKENEELKKEIARLRDEIASLIGEMSVKREKESERENKNPNFISGDLLTLQPSVPFDDFIKVQNFYLNFDKEIDKISANVNNIVNKMSATFSKLSTNPEKKIKVSTLQEFFQEIQSLVSFLTKFLQKYSQENKTYSSSLSQLLTYVESQYPRSQEQNIPQSNFLSSYRNVIQNVKIFSSSELKNLYYIYQSKTAEEIILNFSERVTAAKSKLDVQVEVETELSEQEMMIMSGSYGSNNSYNLVSNEIKKLKKNNTDSEVIIDILKHYMIISELFFENGLNDKLNEVLGLVKEILYYKIDEKDDNRIFIRKLLNELVCRYNNEIM